MTVCIQCALEAFVAGTRYEPHSEEPEEHMRKCHPQGVPPGVREELERKAMVKLTLEGKDMRDWLGATMKGE